MRFRSLHIKPALKGDSSRARPVGDAARGESGGIGSIASGSVARRPYSNQRCGFRVAKAGGVAARLLLFTSTPQSATPTASRKGEPYENGFHCLRKLRASTQKFIVEAASEKKVRHLACFDDSDASDDSVQGGGWRSYFAPASLSIAILYPSKP